MNDRPLLECGNLVPPLLEKSQPTSLQKSSIEGLSNRQDFFELLRRIDRAQANTSRLGMVNDRSHERLRITQPADLAFASREVLTVVQAPPQVRIKARHFGFFAPYGPLPIHVTEHAFSEAVAKRNHAFEQFVGIMSQRFAVLHYRAWAQLSSMVCHDHNDQHNSFLQHLWQVVGVPPGGVGNLHAQRLRTAYAGAYLPGRRSLRQLKKMLAAYFNVPIHITARHPHWVEGALQHQNQRLGTLGKTRIGSRFFDVQYGAHIQIGPLSARQYQQYQRDSVRLQAMVGICHDFTCHQLMLDISLLINTEPDMAMCLGHQRLSRDSWLKPEFGVYQHRVYQCVT